MDPTATARLPSPYISSYQKSCPHPLYSHSASSIPLQSKGRRSYSATIHSPSASISRSHSRSTSPGSVISPSLSMTNSHSQTGHWTAHSSCRLENHVRVSGGLRTSIRVAQQGQETSTSSPLMTFLSLQSGWD